MSGIRWGYALNQWDTNIDAFVRKRDHERAFKTISISGFSGVELTAESFGPWEPLGSPEQIALTAKNFKVYYKKVPGKTPGSYTMDHTAGFYVFDPKGKIRLFEREGVTAQDLAQDVNALLDGH